MKVKYSNIILRYFVAYLVTLKLAVFPIRFKIDQKTLDFLIRFFGASEPASQSQGSANIPDETFFRMFPLLFMIRKRTNKPNRN